ncbi:hypothetical protein R1sor_004249 [Riccia sorocarpa]|uniref:SP-RING-type domain-containing protein n=1 Tax=Riccia sorocarpa TaxID=122646 RepID=A0ABD3H6R7_9MARC
MCTLLELLNRRLQEGFQGTRPLEKKDLVNHLLQISRAIDHAVASDQRPVNSQRCLEIMKTITRLKDDDFIKPAMVVFLLAVKGTCRAGWFKVQEADELTSLYDQLLLQFQLDGNCSRQLTTAGSTQEENLDTITLIKSVCQRYCPRVKLGSVIMSFTTKKEYETRGCDFIVTQLAPKTKLSLFVIQAENTETSACLVTPNSLSFILNGRGVERRSSLQNSPELGPQMPTDVMQFLRLGNNFIQVVGESPGKYVVAIAATSVTPYSSSTVELAEYVVPSTEGDAIDDEVVEAGSRISLRCPISHKRIVTPVKGVLCKHHQCFDFDSYIEMNELRPVWRCPCCNTCVSCIQIRLDKKMKQILKDVDEKCFEAIINQDGTWIPAHSADEQKDVGTARITSVGSGAEWNQLHGVDVITSESGIIQLSDDDEMEPAVPAEKIKSPKVHPFSTAVPNDSEGLEDRKPNIRAASGGNVFQSAGLVGSSDRDRPNTSAGCSPVEDASIHLGVPNNTSGVTPDSSGGIRYMQTPSSATHLWSGGNVGMHAFPFSTGQQIGNGVSSVDRNVYSSAGVSTSVPGGHPTFVQRSRPHPQSVVAGTSTTGGFVTSTSQLHSGHQLPVLVGSSQVFQHDTQPQQSQDLLQRNLNSFRASVDMSHRRGSRDGVGQGTMMNDQGFTRQGNIQQFASATANLTEQSAQTYSQLGQLSMSRQDWQTQRVAQLHQAALNNANPRVGGGRSPTVSVGPSAMAPPAGVQQGPSSRSNSRVVNAGDANRMSNPPALTSNNTIGPAASQALNWRPTGRMRGSVSGGYQVVNRTGVSSVSLQPGPVNRARPSAAPNTTTSMPVLNSVNLVPLSTNTSPTPDTNTPDALLSSGETLQDVIWLPTLGADQVDDGGTQVVDSWFSETPLANSSGGL